MSSQQQQPLTVNFTVNHHHPTSGTKAKHPNCDEPIINGFYCHACDTEVETFLTESYTLVCKRCMASFIEVMATPAPPASSSATANSNTQHDNTSSSSRNETSKLTIQHPMETKSAVNLSYTTQSDDTFQLQIEPAHQDTTSSVTATQPTTTTANQRRSWFSSLFNRRARRSDASTSRASTFITVFSGKNKSSPYSGSKQFAASTTCFEENDEECPICQDELFIKGKETLRLTCRHAFHRECIQGWLDRSSTCPYCRQTVSIATLP
ncbi:hypothetical protein K492DRAFT_195950 [Lichtheimia hyalospora FSU 10163]|nr:hypothetical protein K492DRAFT_195950 [Lichtheimia hyalospora FSU 10163]